MKTINLKIKGMHCKSCEMLIGDALKEAGAKSTKIDHKTGNADIEFDEKKMDEKKIKEVIKKEGYEA